MQRLKDLVVRVLNRAVAGHIRRNKIRVIAVAGSIGKTSTTSALRGMLAQKYRVHIPQTAYNTDKSIHLELFNLQFATSLFGWAVQTVRVLVKSFGPSKYDVLVVEIGTDHPGDLRSFAWLQPEMCVLTAIAPEHMEFFRTIDAVAQEEMSVHEFCRQLLINRNTVDSKYVDVSLVDRVSWYGHGERFSAEHYAIHDSQVTADFTIDGRLHEAVKLQVLGVHSLDALTAAAAVGAQCDLSDEQIIQGLQAFTPVAGRMQRLAGIKDSVIIDDTYNASPVANKAALDVLGQFTAPQRIAVLGTMNEMGEYSAQAHREVGEYCDPEVLQLVVTVGQEAERYLAPAAKSKGCKVESFDSPYMAGEYVKTKAQTGAVLLFKGSQNGVFCEEAVKAVLADPADAGKLVRQSEYWMTKKRQQFQDAPS